MVDSRFVQHSLGSLFLRLSLRPVPGLFLTRAEDGEDQEFGAQQSGGHVEDRVPGGQSGLQLNNCGIVYAA